MYRARLSAAGGLVRERTVCPWSGSARGTVGLEGMVHPVGCRVDVGIYRFDFVFIYTTECDAQRAAVDRYLLYTLIYNTQI